MFIVVQLRARRSAQYSKLRSSSKPIMSKYAPHRNSANQPRATSSTICQKCLQTGKPGFSSDCTVNSPCIIVLGHFIYQCKSTRPYVSRPSRTKLLEKPALLAKLNASTKTVAEVPEEFKTKSGTANKILEAKEKEREKEAGPSKKKARRLAIYKIEILPGLAFLHFNAPHLFEYITNLTIVRGADVQDTPAWILDALHQFVNLRSLTITSTTRDDPSPPSPSMSAIMNLIAKAPLRTLVLRRWDFSEDASSLLHILALCSSTLEELSLAWCYIHTPETFPKPVNAELPPVIRLVALRRIRLSHSDLLASQLNRLEILNLDFLRCAYARL
ncbi:hypothetical protein EYR40_009469 [Pleurotus pulmonarius]|nr:hypothetical protein EYR40_009469 [Pleurotus pulmonarius]